MTETTVIKTSVDGEMQSLEEQIKALQAQRAEIAETQVAEREAQVTANIAEVASPFTEQLASLIDDEGWEALDAVGCIGFELKNNLIDGVPTLSISPIRKAAPKAARTSTASGTRRNLRGDFEAVASQAQIAYVDSLDANVEKGKRWGYMNKVVLSDTPTEVQIPS